MEYGTIILEILQAPVVDRKTGSSSAETDSSSESSWRRPGAEERGHSSLRSSCETFIYVYRYINIHLYIYSYIDLYINIYVYTICVHICMYVCVFIYLVIHASIYPLCVYVYMCFLLPGQQRSYARLTEEPRLETVCQHRKPALPRCLS